MKLTKTKLKRIIKEELKKVLQENKPVEQLIADISVDTNPEDWNNPIALVNAHPRRAELLVAIAKDPNIFFALNQDYASSITDDDAAAIKKQALSELP